MPIKQKVFRSCSFLLLLIIGLNGVAELNKRPANRAITAKTSLRANYPGMYGGGPGLAPMTPSMNPNPDMYFGGSQPQPLPGQAYPPLPPQQFPPQQMPPQGYDMGGYGGQMPPQPGMPYDGGGGMPGGMGSPGGLDPNDPVQQALSLHQAGRFADAIQIYESIIINNPPDPRIYASVADAHFRLGNTERGLKYAVESLKLDPNYASGHLILGTILGDMGDMVRAIRAYERVIALDQNNPYAYYNLGLLYYKKSDIRTALEYLERARDLNPNDPKIWNNLGVAYYDNGQLTKAAAAYSQALGLDPMYETAKRNLELVRGKLPVVAYNKPRKSVKRKGAKYRSKNGVKGKKVVKKK
jgi:Flp pilus assembly protein TadD